MKRRRRLWELFITSDDIAAFHPDIGEHVEYGGRVFCVLSADNIDGLVHLREIRNPGYAEMPEPFEHFMARHKARIHTIGMTEPQP